MNDYLILDLLFGVIVALFAAIGLWRGVTKEIVVTAAIFTGAALAAAWSNPWGDDLARQFDIRDDVAKMIVTGIALLGATLVLGYGGSALVSAREPRWGGRAAGGVVAAINGLLLLHYVLDGIESFFTGASAREALERSHVARLLLRQFGWLLIGAVALLTLIVLVSRVLRRGSATDSVNVDQTEFPLDHPMSRGRPARLPREADGGKYEPTAAGFDPASGRYAADAPTTRQTIAIAPIDPRQVAANGGRLASQNGSEPQRYDGREWLRRSPYTELEQPAVTANGAASQRWQPERPKDRCARCGSTVSASDDFCPQCGSRVPAS